ncbi:MAG: methyltransferase domain-containing protein [Candidatus Hadarchaeaceae archaeon]
MSRLMFVLSGEHRTLPAAEVEAAIRAEHRCFKMVEQLDQVTVLETKTNPEILASRLAMCRAICYHLCTSRNTEEDILEAIGSSDIVDLIPHGKTFAVRVERVKRSSSSINTIELSKKVARAVAEEVEFKVDLVHPQIELLGILTGDSGVFGVTAARVDRKQFTRRRPTARPAFHPGTLKPVLARGMVNLARTPRGGTFLDPFCGVGGLLVEAGIIGARPIGVDISEEMIDGARANLEAIGIKDHKLLVGDARSLPPMLVDAIATDPPYGRQSSTAGMKLAELYRESLPSIAGTLKKRGFLCITSPAGLELEDLAASAGLAKVEQHEQRVHRSLTRLIYVFRKK